MKKVAILIPVFNHLENTKKCIVALKKQIQDPGLQHTHFDIVVTDDGSTDGTSEWLSGNHPDVHVVKGDGNLWWSGSINLGADYAISTLKADFLMIWDNDLIAADDYYLSLDRLIPDLDERTIAGSKMYFFTGEKTDIIWSFGGRFDPVRGVRNMIAYLEKDQEAYATPGEADWLPGMGTLFPASIVEDIGWWDEKVFPQYHGDSDYTFRAKKAGYRILVFPALVLWNDQTFTGLKHSGTLKGLYLSLTSRRSNSNIRKNLQFYRRHATSPRAYFFLFSLYFKYIGGFFKWKVLSLFGIKKNDPVS
jgi:GT2 family glycosyltransferase